MAFITFSYIGRVLSWFSDGVYGLIHYLLCELLATRRIPYILFRILTHSFEVVCFYIPCFLMTRFYLDMASDYMLPLEGATNFIERITNFLPFISTFTSCATVGDSFPEKVFFGFTGCLLLWVFTLLYYSIIYGYLISKMKQYSPKFDLTLLAEESDSFNLLAEILTSIQDFIKNFWLLFSAFRKGAYSVITIIIIATIYVFSSKSYLENTNLIDVVLNDFPFGDILLTFYSFIYTTITTKLFQLGCTKCVDKLPPETIQQIAKKSFELEIKSVHSEQDVLYKQTVKEKERYFAEQAACANRNNDYYNNSYYEEDIQTPEDYSSTDFDDLMSEVQDSVDKLTK